MLDGGLATELENRDHVLDTPLWSAALLQAQPEAIRAVHLDFLKAGADCIVTASYQASIEGFCSLGMTRGEAEGLLRRAVDVALEARERFVNAPSIRTPERRRPLIAASIGPYGAYLADGSEYRGHYPVGKHELRAFHEPRWKILVDCQPDLLAIETIPSYPEAVVLRDLLECTPEMPAWVSFACQDARRINDGADIEECARLYATCPQIVAIGVNCTAPRHVPSLIQHILKAAPDKEVVVYPNSGETFDPVGKRWTGVCDPIDFGAQARHWHTEGARLIGGCCRVGPGHIRAMRQALCESEPTSDPVHA